MPSLQKLLEFSTGLLVRIGARHGDWPTKKSVRVGRGSRSWRPGPFPAGNRDVSAVEAAPKLILLDFPLRNVDGLNVPKRIENDPRTKSFEGISAAVVGGRLFKPFSEELH